MSAVQLAGPQRHSCGYCKDGESVSFGVEAKRLTCEHYQRMIDRGWRRCGTYVYKPTMHETCCPQYAIRLRVSSFRPNKAQKRCKRRFERLQGGLAARETEQQREGPRSAQQPLGGLLEELLNGPLRASLLEMTAGEAGTEAAAKWKVRQKKKSKKHAVQEQTDDKVEVSTSVALATFHALAKKGTCAFEKPQELAEALRSKLGQALESSENVPRAVLDALTISVESSSWIIASVDRAILSGAFELNDGMDLEDSSAPRPDHDSEGAGTSPEDAFGGKGAGILHSQGASHAEAVADPVARLASKNGGRLDLRVVVKRAKLREEAFQLYCRYQQAVHDDKLEDLSERSYERFLCTNPFLKKKKKNLKGPRNGAQEGNRGEKRTRENGRSARDATSHRQDGSGGAGGRDDVDDDDDDDDDDGHDSGGLDDNEDDDDDDDALGNDHGNDDEHPASAAAGEGEDQGQGEDDPEYTLSESYTLPEGAYHMYYILNEELVAVGVVDILPNCLSSVYCFYDPELRALELGKLVALWEIDWLAQAKRPGCDFYYLGYYVHDCVKMAYKGQYHPSELLCPETFRWVQLDAAAPILDSRKYARLCDEPLSEEDPNITVCTESFGGGALKRVARAAGHQLVPGTEVGELRSIVRQILRRPQPLSQGSAADRPWLVHEAALVPFTDALEFSVRRSRLTLSMLTQDSRSYVSPILQSYVEGIGPSLAQEIDLSF